MGKVILIHANCHNVTARGDFVFAGNIAKDMVRELQAQQVDDTDIVLVSTDDGVKRFEGIYGAPIQGRIDIEGSSVGLSTFDRFDAMTHTVVGFIDANRCKHAPGNMVKRLLSPETKFLFVGNVNQSYSEIYSANVWMKQQYLWNRMIEQPDIYQYFDDDDILIGSAGVGDDRLGLPTIAKVSDLPELTQPQQDLLPTGTYGFLYLAAVDSSKDYKLMAQYMKLTGFSNYCLVGDFVHDHDRIANAYRWDMSVTGLSQLPHIEYRQSLPYLVMRQAMAHSAGDLVASTGVTSTLEAMRDNKLPFYQDMDNNTVFVAAHLQAVKAMVASDTALFGALPKMIIELSELLFAEKPLSKQSAQRTHELLESSVVRSKLIATHQEIVDRASGKIAPRLLGFIGNGRHMHSSVQLATVCSSLRKKGETTNPVHEQALRRAAGLGRLFELKVLIKSMSKDELNKKDPVLARTAMHWAVLAKSPACVQALLAAGCVTDEQDKDGCTPLHFATKAGMRVIIDLLLAAGASLEISNGLSQTPKDCIQDNDLLQYVEHCQESNKRKRSVSPDSVMFAHSA